MTQDAIDLDAVAKPHKRGCPKSFAKLRALLAADLYRYAGRTGLGPFLKHVIFTPGFKCTVAMRTCGWLKTKPFLAFGLYPLSKAILLRLRHKYGIAIPEYTVVGPGLFINRFSGIFVHGDAVLGSNVNMTHGTMLGQTNRGARAGAPTVGDRVFFGAGAKVIGAIRIGDDCAVGANAVVTKDVPDGGVVGGVPAKLLSTEGAGDYIRRRVPEDLMRKCASPFIGEA